MIKVGDRMPSARLVEMRDGKPVFVTTDSLFQGKIVVLFAVPGAFSPLCTVSHVPGFVQSYEALTAQGADTIACVSVNDAFVMGAWARVVGSGDKVRMLADGNGDFTRALGQEMDAVNWGMGRRSARYAAVVMNCLLTCLNVDEPGVLEVSSAEYLLKSNQLIQTRERAKEASFD